MLANITCSGLENSISECTPYAPEDCLQNGNIGLRCFGKYFIIILYIHIYIYISTFTYTHKYNFCNSRKGTQVTYLLLYVDPGECEEGSVRLVDGIIEQEGRLEVCVNEVWGNICDDGWDKTDAYVICQQLGYLDLGR